MANIFSYLQWRGDLTFEERAFCEVDNLILALIPRQNLQGIVPESGEGLPLSEAAAQYRARVQASDAAADPGTDFLAQLAGTRRYANVRLSDYRMWIDDEGVRLFSAVTAELGDGTGYAAFWGADEGLTGWRRTFRMSFQHAPVHDWAAECLQKVLEDSDVPALRAGGHGLGGTLALYAVLNLPAEKQGRILQIYCNDSPGLSAELADEKALVPLRGKITRILPEFGVLGNLFRPVDTAVLAESSAAEFAQHDPLSWQVEGNHFAHPAALDPACASINEDLKKQITDADPVQRAEFTEAFFDAMERRGLSFEASSVREVENVLRAQARAQSRKGRAQDRQGFFRPYLDTLRSARLDTFLEERETLCGFLLFLVGCFFVGIPGLAANCVGLVLGVLALLWLGRHLLTLIFTGEPVPDSDRNLILLHLVGMCALAYLIAQRTLLVHVSSLLLGLCFLAGAYWFAKRGLQQVRAAESRAVNLALAAVSFLLGMIPIVGGGEALQMYVFGAGVFLVVCGVGCILHALYKSGKLNAGEVPGDAAAAPADSAPPEPVLPEPEPVPDESAGADASGAGPSDPEDSPEESA